MARDACAMALAVREDREICGAEAMAERHDGRRISFRSHSTLKHDAQSKLVGALHTLVVLSPPEFRSDPAARLAAIVSSSHDAIVSKDLNGIITSWNASAERVFGYSAAEIIGKSVTILIPPDRQDEEPHILERIRNGELVDHFETIRVRKDGSRVPISLTISPIRVDDGTIIGVSKIARDITEQKENERRIRTLIQEVNHRVRNQFAVILSMIRNRNTREINPSHFEWLVRERILALSRSLDLLVQRDWRGVSMADLVQAHIRNIGSDEAVILRGPSLTLLPKAVQYLGMAFHELAMNSARFGVLAQGTGQITIEWSIEEGKEEADRRLKLSWVEREVPEVGAIGESGFGRTVLERLAPSAVGGKGVLELGRDGVVWSMEAPLQAVEGRGEESEDLREF